jgi:hypothetical protein
MALTSAALKHDDVVKIANRSAPDRDNLEESAPLAHGMRRADECVALSVVLTGQVALLGTADCCFKNSEEA